MPTRRKQPNLTKWSKEEVKDLFYQLRHMFFDGATYTNHVSIVQFQNELRKLINQNKRGQSHGN